MKTLVTGGTGFIGGYLVRALLERGERVKVLSRDPGNLTEEIRRKVEVLKHDLADISPRNRSFEGIDIVYHLAGHVHVDSNPREKADIERSRQTNVDGTRRLLDALGRDVKHVVFFSSVKVYDDRGPDICRDEESPTEPNTVYGKAKLDAENMIKEWGEGRKVKTTSLRLPLVYGPGNKGNIDRMVLAIKQGRFVIFGNGLNRRSMVYVGNVVDAALAVTGRAEADKKVYIVTDGVDYTLAELCSLISGYFGKSRRVPHVPLALARFLAKAGDIGGSLSGKNIIFNSDMLSKLSDQSTFSSKRIREEIGFAPKYNFYNTIDETLVLYRRNTLNE